MKDESKKTNVYQELLKHLFGPVDLNAQKGTKVCVTVSELNPVTVATAVLVVAIHSSFGKLELLESLWQYCVPISVAASNFQLAAFCPSSPRQEFPISPWALFPSS